MTCELEVYIMKIINEVKLDFPSTSANEGFALSLIHISYA